MEFFLLQELQFVDQIASNSLKVVPSEQSSDPGQLTGFLSELKDMLHKLLGVVRGL